MARQFARIVVLSSPSQMMHGPWIAGVARRKITPGSDVELAGLGYYLQRTAQRVRDDLTATALVLGDGNNWVCFLALDLMYNDSAFTQSVRSMISSRTGLRPEAICTNFSHSHGAPTAGLIRGAGERSPPYLQFAAEQAAAAAMEAWRRRQPAKLAVGFSALEAMTFNRARENGPVDPAVGILSVETADGAPLALAVNFHSHCTAHMEVDLNAASRDWPGEVADQLEEQFPGTTALYWQGNCGDVNFRREFNNTERRFEPARAVTSAALHALQNSRPIEPTAVSCHTSIAALPTRRWTAEEIATEREEGLHRLNTGDATGWLSGMVRVYVGQPERLPLRYGGSVEKAVAAISRFAVEWTDAALPALKNKPEVLRTELQAFRVGDLFFAAHPSELFATLGLQLRSRWPSELFMLGLSNGSIGYMPDAFEIARAGYAALQSPKMTGRFPFTQESGPALVNALLELLHSCK